MTLVTLFFHTQRSYEFAGDYFREGVGENVDGKIVCMRPKMSLGLKISLTGRLINISAVMCLPLSY